MLIGVVGKPSTGKSTTFKALTRADIDIANYPFTTIKANMAVGYVKIRDAAADFDKVSNPREGYTVDGWRFVPVELMDVAGLVPGAHEGQGMGNAFLEDIRQADCLIHVVDISGSVNEKGEPVNPGEYDPANDIEFLEHELDMWYLGILNKGWTKFARQAMQTKTEIHIALAKQLSAFKVTEEIAESEIKKMGLDNINPTEWSEEQLKDLASTFRKITKPMIIFCNKIDVPGAQENFDRVKKQFSDHIFVAGSSMAENALRDLQEQEKIKYIPGEDKFEVIGELEDKDKQILDFIQSNVLDKHKGTGCQTALNTATFELLKMIPVFPGSSKGLTDSQGRVMPDCYLMPPESTALDFAYRLHTDFGKNFIKAINVRKNLPVGKDYKLEFADVIEIMAK